MASYPIEIRRCQHVKMDGNPCGSPALRDEDYCYYHTQNRPERLRGTNIVWPSLEDAASVQVALSYLSKMLMNSQIEYRPAALVLSALRTASSNLKRMHEEKMLAARAEAQARAAEEANTEAELRSLREEVKRLREQVSERAWAAMPDESEAETTKRNIAGPAGEVHPADEPIAPKDVAKEEAQLVKELVSSNTELDSLEPDYASAATIPPRNEVFGGAGRLDGAEPVAANPPA